ncbi:class I SAM-dependent methyltransferase [Ammoniphilus resinae]|uniref:Ubiquinone/menaquinone biosynthesis C-methylase UbiE n=1 Tax=Ammoniphilus resinae TaxID=861532 RepID=A0ABS4GL10_9BACL|nr:methyltransferase domain-containing protein [Ammoniphilus resinae]MBP1930947.1 ubiquinone/menaquinone biosynthesis C-methylase UbiE [Ammoniphilus resinae]
MADQENLKETVKEQFARNAEKYVTSPTHAKGNDLDLLVEWMEPKENWTVLDIATGGGHVTKKLSPHVSRVIATDLTRGMLEAAKKHVQPTCQNVWFMVADAENLPFLDDTFDAITCRIAAHHFPQPHLFIQEAARVLNPGGKLILIDNVVPADEVLAKFVNKLEKLRDESHGRCCSIEEFTKWAMEARLSLEKSRLRKKTFDFPTWVRRTTRSEDQVKQVERHILEADQRLQEYCGLVMKDGTISCIHIDEWMAMFIKK